MDVIFWAGWIAMGLVGLAIVALVVWVEVFQKTQGEIKPEFKEGEEKE